MSMKVPATRTRVGRYEIGKTLGEGSFAKVKYARNSDTGDSVAIKVLDRDHVLRHKMVEQVCFLYFLLFRFFLLIFLNIFVNGGFVQIKREISTMKLIKHPNVVTIFEVFFAIWPVFFFFLRLFYSANCTG